MYRRLKNISISTYYLDKSIVQQLDESNLQCDAAYQNYIIYTHQYAGFGSILQFMPGSAARRARLALSKQLESTINLTLPLLNSDMENKAAITRYLNINLLYSLNSNMGFGFFRFYITSPCHSSFAEMMDELPDILKIKKQSGGFSHLLDSLFNPFIIIRQVLDFIHLRLYNLIDFGENGDERSSFPRILAKGAISLIFGLIKLPVILAEHIVDGVYSLLRNYFYDPICHIGMSIKEAYQHRNESIIELTINQECELESLYSKLSTLQSQEYRTTAYSANNNVLKEIPVAKYVSKKTATEFTNLFQLFDGYKQDHGGQLTVTDSQLITEAEGIVARARQ